MIDLQPAPVPELSDEWMSSHRKALVEALSQRRRKPMKWVALAGGLGTVATVSTIVVVGGSTQSAFAGWSPTPTPPAAGQVTSAVGECQTGLARIPSNLNKNGNPSSLQLELTDVRGPYTVTVFGDDAQHEVVCIASSNNTAVRWISQSGAPVSPGAIAVDQISYMVHGGQPYTLVVGRTGIGVIAVTLSLGDGSQVTATSGNGVFVAWWPGSRSVNSAAVATAAGTSTQTLNLMGPGASSPPGAKSGPLPQGGQSSSTSANSTVCLIQSCGGTGN